MTSPVSGLLVAVLSMSALLGVLIGIAATSLVNRRRRETSPRPAERSADSRADEDARSHAGVVERLQGAERERDELREALVSARAGERDAVTRHDALRMHARALGRRLDTQLGEQRASEERQIRLERALRVQREEYRLVDAAAGSLHEPGEQAPGAASSATPRKAVGLDSAARGVASVTSRGEQRAGDGDVPVLGRRVGGETGDPARAKRTFRARPGDVGTRAAASSRRTGSSLREGLDERSTTRSTTRLRKGTRLGSGRLVRSSARAVPASLTSAALDDDDYPVLSEAELPDSIDALEFASSRTASSSS